MENCKIKPIDAFQTSFKWLKITGYFMAVPKIRNPTKALLYDLYRAFTLIILILYDVQHMIFIVQVIGNVEYLIDSFTVLITSMNVTIKLFLVNLNSRRFERLHDIINDDIFSASSIKDEEIMGENKKELEKLAKIIYTTIAIIAVCWLTAPFLKKLSDGHVTLTAYFPFDTNNWFGFTCANIWITFIIVWVGYGHMTLNILLVGYYSQVKVQLSIIKQHLEHMADDDIDLTETRNHTIYLDNANDNWDVQKKFVKLVNKYEKIVWFYNEVELLLNKPMLVQFCGSTGIICAVVYKMTGMSVNATFIYLILYLGCLVLELYIYCYYGTLMNNESIFVNDSVYQSNWTSLSPRFRRQLLIAMTRWSRPLTPKAAGLVSINLNTFVSVMRLSYSIYTILKS
nr:odorant receptor 33 [Achelura yunnanensis]